MKHYFLDTSALVKAYSEEAGSKRVQSMMRGAIVQPPDNRLVASTLAHPETASAIAQILDGPGAARRGFGQMHRQELPHALAHELATAVSLTSSDPHMEHAADLVWKHRLRGADAVHLATAIAARQKIPSDSEFYFVSSDVALNRAAAAEGLEVIDPAV